MVRRSATLRPLQIKTFPWLNRDSRGHSALPMAWVLLVVGIGLALTSRVLVVFGGLPGVINFMHLPVILAAYLLSRTQAADQSILTIERVLGASGLLVLASLLGSTDSSFLRTILLWPILVEPVVVILTIWHLHASGFEMRSARNLGMLVVLGQLPVALAQAAGSGFSFGDHVQGTLIRQGAGHHVLGSIGLMAALICLARIVSGRQRLVSFSGFAVAGGFLLAFMSDMKQGIAMFFLVAVFVLVRGLRERRHLRGSQWRPRRGWLATALLAGLVIAAILIVNIFVILAREPWRFTAPFEAKAATITVINEEMSGNPITFLVGVGPGTTATRIAWLSAPSAPPSSASDLGLQSAPIAAQLALAWETNPIWLQSSISAPFATWLGVYGDFGLLGLAAIAALWWLPWRITRSSPDRLGAQAVILFTVLLGVLFNWMEEPVLVIVAALLIGAFGAPSNEERTVTVAFSTPVPSRVHRHRPPTPGN